MLIAYFFLLYFTFSLLIFFIFKFRKKQFFLPPKNSALFYILSFTWGLPAVLFGAFAALFIRMIGYRPKKYGWGWCFEIPGINWGLNLGLFFIAPPDNERIRMHEHGHSIQNMYLGPFFPFAVSFPSVIRFWYRKILAKRKKQIREYDSAWFEKSATASGYALISRLKK